MEEISQQSHWRFHDMLQVMWSLIPKITSFGKIQQNIVAVNTVVVDQTIYARSGILPYTLTLLRTIIHETHIVLFRTRNAKNVNWATIFRRIYAFYYHCVKSVQILSYFLYVFYKPYSVRIQENTDQKWLRIWRLFTQCSFSCLLQLLKTCSFSALLFSWGW